MRKPKEVVRDDGSALQVRMQDINVVSSSAHSDAWQTCDFISQLKDTRYAVLVHGNEDSGNKPQNWGKQCTSRGRTILDMLRARGDGRPGSASDFNHEKNSFNLKSFSALSHALGQIRMFSGRVDFLFLSSGTGRPAAARKRGLRPAAAGSRDV